MVNGGRVVGTAGYDEVWENPHFPRVGTKQNKVLLEVASGELGSGSTFLGSGEPDYAPPMQEAQAANPEVHAAETASSTASSHESDQQLPASARTEIYAIDRRLRRLEATMGAALKHLREQMWRRNLI